MKIERLKSPQAEHPTPPEIYKIKPSKFDVKINLERKDGERIQFACHRFDKKHLDHQIHLIVNPLEAE